MRPLTRLRLILPASKGDPRATAPIELLANRVADALALLGVQVRQQIQGAAPDGAPRADVALWLPELDGGTPNPDARAAPARVHVALVVEPESSPRHLGRYDALLVPCEQLRAPVRAAMRRGGARDVSILVSRLPGDPPVAREPEKATRGVPGRRVVLLDLRERFDEDIERIVVQLALLGQEAAVVLLVPHDEHARARVRTLCGRHGVDAWLTSGPEAFTGAVAAADLVVGSPRWDELLVAALHRTPVAFLPMPSGRALLDALQAAGATRGGLRPFDEVPGPLQLAAALDHRLADRGALEARGLALRDALFGAERDLVEALSTVEPMPHGAPAAAAWEAVGPHAVQAPPTVERVVEARETLSPARPSRAQKIEDALDELKRRLHVEATTDGTAS